MRSTRPEALHRLYCSIGSVSLSSLPLPLFYDMEGPIFFRNNTVFTFAAEQFRYLCYQRTAGHRPQTADSGHAATPTTGRPNASLPCIPSLLAAPENRPAKTPTPQTQKSFKLFPVTFSAFTRHIRVD